MTQPQIYLYAEQQQKRVVVLTSIYKGRRFLEAKLANFESQTAFADCLFVLLNCQNIENENDICLPWAYRHQNVIVVTHEEHIRLYQSWNFGISITSSEFIMNSNVDDMLHPACISQLITTLDDCHDCDVAHCDAYVTDIPNQAWPLWRWHGLIETIYPGGTAGPGPIWRRSLHDKFGPFNNYNVIGDADIWERWHANGIKFKNIPIPLMLYYHAPEHNLELRIDESSGKSLRDIDMEMRNNY